MKRNACTSLCEAVLRTLKNKELQCIGNNNGIIAQYAGTQTTRAEQIICSKKELFD